MLINEILISLLANLKMSNIAYIYKIQCSKSGKLYIGQTKHSVRERWLHHIRMSRYNADSHPITKAINTFGKEYFTIEELEKCEMKERFMRENYWIDFYKTIQPNGYNVMKNTNYRERKDFLENHLVDAEYIEIVPIKNSGLYTRIYVLFHFDLSKFNLSEEKEIFSIRYDYKDPDNNFEFFREKIISDINSKYNDILPIKISSKFNLEDKLSKYRDKLDEALKITIKKIKISTLTQKKRNITLCSVYITDKYKPGWKDQKRFCFGGLNINLNDAITSAREFCIELQRLCGYEIEIEDKLIQCQQQEATIETVV
jgi:predicted GIY-YIG superfamily endonuclease